MESKESNDNLLIRLYRKLSIFKNRKAWAIFLILTPIFALIGYILFMNVSWQQVRYWPYDFPEKDVTSGLGIIIAGSIFSVITLIVLIFSGIILLKKKRTRIFSKIKSKFPNLLVKVWAIGILGGGIALMALAVPDIKHNYYNAGPYLTWDIDQNPSNSITVCWHSAFAQPSEVSYGTESENLDQTATNSEQNGRYHWVALENLDPSKKYYYEVKGQEFGMKSFRTAPAQGSYNGQFSFCMYADPRTNNGNDDALDPANPYGENMPKEIMKHMQKEEKDLAFSLVAGDIVSRGVDYRSWWLWLNDISTSDFASNYSHQIAIGNHEHHDDPTARNMHNYYPYDNYSYSFTYGQVHFLVLDPYDYENGIWVDLQFPNDLKQWALNDLEAHKDVPFQVISLHQSTINYGDFSDGGHHGNISEAIFELTNNYDVDLVFSGHSHHYEVSKLNETLFMEAGTGGNHNREDWVYNGGENDVVNAGGTIMDWGGGESSFCQVDVNGNEMHIRTILLNGSEKRDYVIPAN